MVYLDDMLAYSKKQSFHVRCVLQKLRDNKLFAKLGKHAFDLPQLDYRIPIEGIQLDAAKIEAIPSWNKHTHTNMII